MAPLCNTWSPSSWKNFPAAQQPKYQDDKALDDVCSGLVSLDAIVGIKEIYELKAELARLQNSDCEVMLHAGDCAETFSSCSLDRLARDISFLSDMSDVLDSSLLVGRICGQFGKPRSYSTEVDFNNNRVPVFRGDIINGVHTEHREADAERMRTAYSLSVKMVRDLESMVVSGRNNSSQQSCIFQKSFSPNYVYTSHECLLLPYESSLVRTHEGQHYATSAHFLWIGDRTRDLNGAHVEFCRGIENPIGIKIGSSVIPKELRSIIQKINPNNVDGKIVLITRFGANADIKTILTDLITELNGLSVLWQCDPMHGNTVVRNGYKTRYVDDIKNEIERTVRAHIANNSRNHGIHLETTGADVTECIGCNVTEEQIPLRYQSVCDPRLNPHQTRDVLAFANELLYSARKSTNKSFSSLSTVFQSDAESSSSSTDSAISL